MNNDVFDGHILAEKLSKLNNSQQSIESLSRWCISHRKKARQIVETWDRLFKSSQREQRVSFLYLANDILQNSRRKGSEFVNEFWKVLPAALRLVCENGDEHGKKAVTRLVDIWEERKVFGSRAQSLKDEMLSKNPPSMLLTNGKSSNPIKIVKRDAHSVRIKLAVGGLPEKILTAFQSVLDENVNEESSLSKCYTAVSHVGKIGEDVENASSQGNQLTSTLVDDLREQENVLHQCVEQLENAEAARAELVSLLREALQEQELKLEVIRSQLQVARGQFEQAISIRKRVMSSLPAGPSTTNAISPTEAMKVTEQNMPLVQRVSTPPQPPFTQPAVSYAPLRATDEESKKAAAAAVAAKLAASTSSAQMLTSVLSSLVAEEAASMNGSLKSSGFTSGLSVFSPEKRQKLEKPMAVSDGSNSDAGGMPYFTPIQMQPGNNMPHAPSASVQSISQSSQAHSSYAAPPPLPPPPPLSPANPSANQFAQSTGTMVGVMPYGYGANALPTPLPLPPHITMGLTRPTPQPPQPPLQLQPQPQQSQEQQSPASGGYYRPPGIAFYGQSHQPKTPALPRQ